MGETNTPQQQQEEAAPETQANIQECNTNEKNSLM